MNFTEFTSEKALGTVVRSKSGRDRKRVFLVIGLDTENSAAPIIIADGRLRKIEDQKHKNPAHLEYVGVIDKSDTERLSESLTNGEIAEICDKFDFR